jgi:hypothetical protein
MDECKPLNTGALSTSGNSFWDTPCAFPIFTNLTRATTFNIFTVVTHINATTGLHSDSTGPDGDAVYYAEFTRVPERNVARTTDNLAPFFKPGYPRITEAREFSKTSTRPTLSLLLLLLCAFTLTVSQLRPRFEGLFSMALLLNLLLLFLHASVCAFTLTVSQLQPRLECLFS